jgi:hypothetical protein
MAEFAPESRQLSGLPRSFQMAPANIYFPGNFMVEITIREYHVKAEQNILLRLILGREQRVSVPAPS